MTKFKHFIFLPKTPVEIPASGGNMPDPTTKSTSQSIFYDGKCGQLYKIFLLNLFLGIITLGIYHFWGKTRTRKYLATSCQLTHDRFEYNGKGLELFLGFLKVLILLAVISIPLFFAVYQVDLVNEKIKLLTSQYPGKDVTQYLSREETLNYLYANIVIVAYLFIYVFWLPFLAFFETLRYRASRLQWRGIRGALVGSSFVYGLLGILHTFLNIVTAWLWSPFADLMLYKYKVSRLKFGSQSFYFTPAYGRLFLTHILTLGLSGMILLAAVALGLYLKHTGFDASGKFISSATNISIIFLILLISLLSYLPRFWYKAALDRMRYNNLSLGMLGFESSIKGWPLAKQIMGNSMIYVLTLGFGIPWVTHRRMKFFSENVRVTGDLNNIQVSQAKGELQKTGEGLGATFDVNIKLF